MTVQNGHSSARADHRRHDRLLVTRYAMDDPYPGERDEASQLIATCAECAQLAADVRVIAATMKQLPAPRRPRDFTISQEQADRLRGSRLTQVLRGLATPGWATLRPVAGVALSIGLVMAVVGSVIPDQSPAPGGDGGSLQMIQEDETFGVEASPPPRPAAAASPGSAGAPDAGRTPEAVNVPSPAASAGGETVPDIAESPAPAYAPAATGAPTDPSVPAIAAPGGTPADRSNDLEPEPNAGPTQDAATDQLNNAYTEEPSPRVALSAGGNDDSGSLLQASTADPTRDLLIYAGLAIAVISLAVLVVAWGARRYIADPLLR